MLAVPKNHWSAFRVYAYDQSILLPFLRHLYRSQIFYLQNILYISVTDIESEKVYLFYSNGTAVQGFPVYGTSGIDLTNADQDKALEMVVLSEKDGILVYEINP